MDQPTQYQPRRSAAEWQQIINQFKESGLSQVEYAKQNDLTAYQISYWLKKHKAKKATPKFLPIKTAASTSKTK